MLAADRWPHDFRCGWKFSFAFRLYLTQLNLFQLIFLAGCEYKARLVYSILSEWVWTSHQSYWGKWSVFWGFSSGSSLSEPWMPFLRFSTPFFTGTPQLPNSRGTESQSKEHGHPEVSLWTWKNNFKALYQHKCSFISIFQVNTCLSPHCLIRRKPDNFIFFPHPKFSRTTRHYTVSRNHVCPHSVCSHWCPLSGV